MKVLVIEDDVKIATALREGLEAEGFGVAVAHTGEDGYFRATTETVDLILLDLNLPGRSGLDILQALRSRGITTQVLILTARDAIDDRVAGLDAGGDDYLVKPFAFPELLARVRALLRRGRPDQALRLKVADLEMDLITRKVIRQGQSVDLTAKEHDLLELLMRHAGQVVSREMIAHEVWHETVRATPLDNVIDVHVARLRRKIDDPFSVKLLQTVRGVGYSVSALGERPPARPARP